MNKLGGIYSALLCAYDANGRPDENALGSVVDFNIDVSGIDGLYVNGSTGESFNMSLCDRKTVIRAAASHTAGRVKLIAQVGCNVLEEIYELCDLCAECGYDAVSAVAPFYYPYSKAELIAHYKRIADYSKLPLVIYNIPVRTGVALTLADFRELLGYKNIAGVKFTSNDFFLLEQVRSEFPEALILSGFDEMLLSAAVLGTDGAIGSTYNFIGFWAKTVMDGVHSGNLAAAFAAQHKINGAVQLMLDGGILPVMKAMLAQYGVCDTGCRLPMAALTDEHRMCACAVKNYIDSNK
ncbi:MAG: N-acetylneuraminate lyase [Eubacteriales bacterium]